MDSDLKTEFAELKGMLTGIIKGIENVDEDVKSLASDVKEIKSDVAGQGRDIARIQAKIEHCENEVEKLHAEDQKLWDHFPKHKEEIEKYIGIVVKEAISSQKVWFYGVAATAAGAIIAHFFR